MKIEEKNGALVITDFNEFDAYRIAVAIEKDGMELYEKLLALDLKPAVRETLKFLKSQEGHHISIFEELLQQLRDAGEDTSEDNDLLTSMNFGIFEPYQSMEGLQDALTDIDKAVRLGLLFEKKSIAFYQACKEKVSSTQAAGELTAIIKEEQRHKALLEGILKR